MSTFILIGAVITVGIIIGEIVVHQTKQKYSPFKSKP